MLIRNWTLVKPTRIIMFMELTATVPNDPVTFLTICREITSRNKLIVTIILIPANLCLCRRVNPKPIKIHEPYGEFVIHGVKRGTGDIQREKNKLYPKNWGSKPLL